jgi:hypothetical protein
MVMYSNKCTIYQERRVIDLIMPQPWRFAVLENAQWVRNVEKRIVGASVPDPDALNPDPIRIWSGSMPRFFMAKKKF